MVRQKIKILTLALLVALVAGCGVYSANTGRVDDTIKRVAVRYLENLTSEPNIGVELADAIILALQTDNTLKVVEEGDSDTILSGSVVRYNLKEAFAQEDLTVNQYQVQISVILDLQYRATGEVIFTKKRFSGTGNYILDDPNGTTEQTARDEAATEIVKDILALVVEGW